MPGSNSATAATRLPLNEDWRESIELLNPDGVKYPVIGAFEVAVAA